MYIYCKNSPQKLTQNGERKLKEITKHLMDEKRTETEVNNVLYNECANHLKPGQHVPGQVVEFIQILAYFSQIVRKENIDRL